MGVVRWKPRDSRCIRLGIQSPNTDDFTVSLGLPEVLANRRRFPFKPLPGSKSRRNNRRVDAPTFEIQFVVVHSLLDDLEQVGGCDWDRSERGWRRVIVGVVRVHEASG